MSDELRRLRTQNECLQVELDRLKGSDLYSAGRDEGYQEGVADVEAQAVEEYEWASGRVDELEDLIADFFRGVADAEDLRQAVSA